MVAVIAASTVVLTGTAAATIAWERASDTTKVHCYPKPTTDYDNPQLGPDDTEISGSSAADALELCRLSWADGSLTSIPPSYYNQTPTPQVPPSLFACVLPSGAVGVFPVDLTHHQCSDLGLPRSEG